jgi:hypothetical protein
MPGLVALASGFRLGLAGAGRLTEKGALAWEDWVCLRSWPSPGREHFQGEQWRPQFAGSGVFRWPGPDVAGGAVLVWETMRVTGLARGLSAGLGRWRAPRVVHDPGKIVAHLADVREGYRLENRPLVGAQRDPHSLQRLGRSRV